MKRIEQILDKKEKVVSIFFTAGYPKQGAIKQTCAMLEKAGVDMIEIGIPSSDPLADGPVIQHASAVALGNKTTIAGIFDELSAIRKEVQIPILLMGYYNQVLQFGIEKIIDHVIKCGLDGFIIPDAPFEGKFAELCNKHGLANVKLICPTTSSARIQKLDELSSGFLYAVSSSATTGYEKKEEGNYLGNLRNLNLRNKVITGFGIKNKETFDKATKNTCGGIIGTAFVEFISQPQNMDQERISAFVSQFK